MSEKLLEIQPGELKFVFELQKRSPCTVHLVNNTDFYVAFKVKATSPNKYSVRPNISIVQPKSICDLTVIMEAQQFAPANMKCKDKFLIQSTIAPFGTTEEQIIPSLFVKDNGRHIDERKLRVVLISPPNSPVSHTEALKPVLTSEAPISIDPVTKGVKNLSPPLTVQEDFKLPNAAEFKVDQNAVDGKVAEFEEEFKLTKDVKELKLKLRKMESKLNKVEVSITGLRGERNMTTQELAMSKVDGGPKEIQVGFPFLFVCLVALIALEFGYNLYS